MSWRRIQYAKGANNATISIARFMYYVILENIRGDFSDNTAVQAFKLRIIFKNIGRFVRTVPFRAPYPYPPPPLWSDSRSKTANHAQTFLKRKQT